VKWAGRQAERPAPEPRVCASVAGSHDVLVLVAPQGMTPAEYVLAITGGALKPNDWLRARSRWEFDDTVVHVRAGAVNSVWLGSW
jgi:hypothetical protein